MALDKGLPTAPTELVSDEATQENTPRRSSSDETESDSSVESTHSPTPRPDPPRREAVRIPGVSTVVSWFDDTGEEHILSHDVASAFVQHDPEPKNTAFCRLRVRAGQTPRRTAKQIFLFIPPEHIKALSFCDSTEAARRGGDKTRAALRRAVGTADVVCLCFEMRKPCLLVVPKDLDPHSPSQDNSSPHIVNMLDTVMQLSLRSTFVLYLPSKAISQSALSSM